MRVEQSQPNSGTQSPENSTDYETCDDGNDDDDGYGCTATCQRNGVFVDSAGLGLTWMKCLQEQTFSNNSCSGTHGRFKFCDTDTSDCIDGDGVLNGDGCSEAWDISDELGYAGYHNCRDPTADELVNLVEYTTNNRS